METLYTARLHGFPNLSRSTTESILTEESLLSLLIVLGSSLSLVGLVFAFITYSLFSDLRNLSGTTLINLLAVLFMTQLLYVIGVGGVPDPQLCISLACSLQYIRACVLCWMLVMAHHMYHQFRTNLHLIPVTDNSIGMRYFKCSLFAWGLPGLLLIVSIILQYIEKNGKILDITSLKEQNCWFLDNNAFIYGLVLPSSTLIIFILTYLIKSALIARYVISIQVDKKIREKMRKKRTVQLVLYTKISTLLIAVAILAALTKFLPSKALWIAYHVGQGLQGIFVAMLVTCNCKVLKLYTRSLKYQCNRYAQSYTSTVFGGTEILGKRSSISASSSLQLLTGDPLPHSV